MTPFSFLKSISALVKAFIARVTADGGIVEAARCIVKNTATLAMQPSGYKATKLYSQKPSSGVGDFTVDRNGTKTRVNSLGLIESVAANVPSLDYTDGNCPSLLLEPQSTNFFSRSEEFEDANWIKARITISSNTTSSPNGTLTADSLFCVETSSNGCFIRQTTSLQNERTTSIFVKPNTGDYFQIHRNFGSGVVFDLGNGTVKQSVGATGTIKEYFNGWYRCTATFSDSGVSLFILGNENMTVSSWFSTINQSVYLWGAQLEQSSVATSYIPTIGTTVTRLADVVGGAGDASTFNDSEGVLFFEGARLLGSSNSVILSVNNGSVNNSVAVYYFTTGVRVDIFNSSGTRSLSFTMSLENQSLFNKIAIKYKSNDIALWVNGVEVAVNNQTLSLSGLNQISFDYGNGNFDFYGKTKDLQYYNTALTDAELTELTTL